MDYLYAKFRQRLPNGISTHAAVKYVSRYQNVLIFVASSLLFMSLAAWLSFCVGFVPGDALSRTYSAMAVSHSRYPHLAAIGFIWPPLTALAQVPFAYFLPLTFNGFSGGIISALSAGLFLGVFSYSLQRIRVNWKWRLTFLSLVMINPLWLFFSINGMSEMPFMLVFFVVNLFLMNWIHSMNWQDLCISGVLTAIMFGFRYDAVVYAAIVAVGVLAIYLTRKKQNVVVETEAHLIIYLMPPVYAAFLWVFANWIILGEPLYFLQSNYSNAYLTGIMDNHIIIQLLQGSPFVVVYHFLLHLILISPLLFVLLLLSVFYIIYYRKFSLFVFASITISPVLFQEFMLVRGESFGLVRFFVSFQISGILVLLYFLRQGFLRKGSMLKVGSLFFLLLGVISSFIVMNPPDHIAFSLLHSDFATRAFAERIQSGKVSFEDQFAQDVIVGQEIRERFADEDVLILVDSQAEEVVLYSQIPWRFVLPSDYDYMEILENPEVKADYFLVAAPKSDEIEYHDLTERYSRIYQDGLSGFVLDSQIGEYRLYRNVSRLATEG